MKKNILLISMAIIPLLFLSCNGLRIERVENDIYTITLRDTTYQNFINNAPGNRDNGEILPSSRTFKNDRTMLQIDSTITRKYPDFIRYGLFESAGLIGSSTDNKLGYGIFGIYPDPSDISPNYLGNKDALFSGGLFRIGIIEKRLRWFHDAKNWTWGVHGLEVIAPNALTQNQLWTVLPFYIRKRYYLRTEIPYICATIGGGIGWFPFLSMYSNIYGSLDLGSIGGLNLRAYAGLAGGLNPKWSPTINSENNPNPDKSISVVFPYAGLGISVLDFLNLPEETEMQWKDYKHSSWNIGLIQFGLINTGAKQSAFSDTTDKEIFLKGLVFKLANASVAIPFLDNKFYAGTSLMSIMIFGQREWAVGMLPLRIGYWQTVLTDELTIEPFIEYSYFPTNFFNFGGRLNLAVSQSSYNSYFGGINFSLIFGYATGSTEMKFGGDFVEAIGQPADFSRAYVGLSIGLFDRIFFPEQLKFNK